MLKQKTEYSRYYGDFRGVDFSSDHTLVSERRFPYLVNMYKDYAAGAGQGIETIPGFRRRFVAPNGGKVHGIHSFKDKGGKRRVYVHAGNTLYDWASFPNDTGFLKEAKVVAKDYDEYSSIIEGVGIATDYVKVDVVLTAGSDLTAEHIVDVRAIRKVGSQNWISIYPNSMFYGEPTDALYVPNAYTFTQAVETTHPDENEYNRVYTHGIIFPKIIKDSLGAEVARFYEGDTVEVCCYYVYKDDDNDTPFDKPSNYEITLEEKGRTSLGERIVSFVLKGHPRYPAEVLWYYDKDGNKLNYIHTAGERGVAKDALPKNLTAVNFDVTRVAVIQRADVPIKYYPFGLHGYTNTYTATMLYEGTEALDDIDLANSNFYQYDVDGNKVYLPKDMSKGFVTKVLRYFTRNNLAFTVTDVNEYEELKQSDYVSVDASYRGGLAFVSAKKKSDESVIDSENYRDEGNEILFKKDVVKPGEEVILRFGKTSEDFGVNSIYDDMNEHESQSFVFNNRLYILDGKNYLYIDVTPEEKIEVETEEGTEIKVTPEKTVVKRVADEAYIPTTYINIVVGGENADAGTEYETRNMLSPYFKHTFVPVDSVTEYCMNERDLDGIKEVKVYGKVMKEGEDADYTVDLTDGKVIFNTPPALIKAGFEAVPGTPGLEYTLTDAGTYICSGRGSSVDTEIEIGNYYNGARVTGVDADAFYYTGYPAITKVTISEGITEIDKRAFENRSITEVTLPESLRHIRGYAFVYGGISSITIPKNVETVGSRAFGDADRLTTVVFKGKPQSIANDAFEECSAITSVTVAWSEGAFPNLENNLISLGATITYKGESADEEEDELYYPEAYAGVEITAIKAPGKAKDVVVKNNDGTTTTMKKCPYMYDNAIQMIESATLCTVFDDRVFFSGIPRCPRLILWCGRNLTGYVDPSYIGILNYVEDGVGNSPVKAMLPLANTLLVLKGDTEFDGAVYYHAPRETGVDVMPVTYPSEHGLTGIGCLGAACNFLDDPVFISRLGLEAIGQLSVRYERAREHRSSLIDAKLVNLEGLRDAKMCEWGGYLVLLVDGRIFLADSRQVYQNDRGEVEYEWYYLEDIGVFEGQYKREKYIAEWPELFTQKKAVSGEDGAIPQSSETTAPFTQGSLTGDTTASTERMTLTVTYEGKDYTVQLASDVFPDYPPKEVAAGLPVVFGEVAVNGNTYYYDAAIYSVGGTPAYAFLCDGNGEMIGGEFSHAVTVKSIEEECKAKSAKGRVVENLFFGTENGVVCSFNFDMREADGTIPAEYYTFDERAIYSGCALKMDNCAIPHMTKTTVKKSTVIKVKSFQSTAAKVRVRTNVNPYNEIARINATRFSFDNLDFSDFSFVVGEDSLFAVQEKEKKWVEKQYYIYSDEYKKPFALFYAAFKYFVAGKFKK